MKPIIGITASTVDTEYSRILHTYVKAIEENGGVPLLLPYVEAEETLDAYLSLCDGFFFTGGADIDPRYYGEEEKPTCGSTQPLRDAYEILLARKVLSIQKPILGICRGAQLLNVALGGTLWQDIPSELETDIPHRQDEPKWEPSHSVGILDGTPLSSLIGKKRMVANSFHHQALKRLGDGLAVMALADDGIVEAVYATDRPYLRAFQWHPERLYQLDADNRKLFSDFIEAARRIEQ